MLDIKEIAPTGGTGIAYTSTNPLLGTFPVTSGTELIFIDDGSIPELLRGAVHLTRQFLFLLKN